MKKNQIVVGGRYTARVSGKLVVIRVTDIKEFDPHFNPNSYRQAVTKTRYYGTNESTGRTVIFRSASRFRYSTSSLNSATEIEANRKAVESQLGYCDTRNHWNQHPKCEDCNNWKAVQS